MLTLAHDTLIATWIATTRLVRWLIRDHEFPASECVACMARSARHPAGQLRRYTTGRVAGHPICERHDLHELDELFNGHEYDPA